MKFKTLKALFASALVAAIPVQAIAQAACSLGDMVSFPSVYYEDFGTGARTSDPNVLNHTFRASGAPPDDWYAVDTSAGFGARYMRTTGDLDADGTTTGRYLGINMRGKNEPSGSWEGEFYRQDGVSLLPPGLPAGATLGGFRFSNQMVGTCAGCGDVPNFTLFIEDNDDGARLAEINSNTAGIVNDDQWREVVLNVVPAPSTATAANLVLFNSQPSGANGNDVGVDNIDFAPLVCYAPVLELDKTYEVIANVVGDADAVEAGDIIRYTYTISNNGSATGYNVSLSEVGFTGTGSVPAPTVSSGAADLDGGDGTATDVAVGAQLVYTADYVITQADIDNDGIIENGASIAYEDLVETSFSTSFDADDTETGDQPLIALTPIAAYDNASDGNTFDDPVVVQITDNDAPNAIDGTLNLVPPGGATNIVTDADGDVVGYDVPGQGSWSYDDNTGELTFTPVPGLDEPITPATYTVEGPNGVPSN